MTFCPLASEQGNITFNEYMRSGELKASTFFRKANQVVFMPGNSKR